MEITALKKNILRKIDFLLEFHIKKFIGLKLFTL